VRESFGRHGCARGAQGLRGNLAAVQRQASLRSDFVHAAEEVAVEHFNIEQRAEIMR
jgi:hypothetical protein